MRGARWLAGAVAASVLVFASLWTCAEGAGGPTVGSRSGAPDLREGPSPRTDDSAQDPHSPRSDRPRRTPRAATPAHNGEVAEVDAAAEDEKVLDAIVGRILDADRGEDGPIAGAAIRLHLGVAADPEKDARQYGVAESLPTPAGEVTTGPDGRFSFPVGTAVPWLLVVAAPDRQVEARWGEGPADLGDVYVQPASTVTVLVRDEDERPLPDAEALVLAGGPYPTHRVGADAEGRSRLDSGHDALVTAPGRHAELLRSPREGQRVVLGRAAPIAGRVVDDLGVPLEGFLVVLVEPPGTFTVTGADGSFRFERASVGCATEGCNLQVLGPSGRGGDFLAVPGDEDLRLVVPRVCVVEGVVVFDDGRPAAGVPVANVTTDAEGRFRLTLSPSDGERVSLTAVARTRVAGSSATLPTHVGTAEVALRAGETVSGVRIVVGPRPHSFLRVDVRDEAGNPVAANVWARAPWIEPGTPDGKVPYVFGVAPGTALRVSASAADGRFGATEADGRTAADASAEPLVVRLPGPRTCSIRVVDGSGNPLSAGEAKVVVTATRWVVVAPDGSVVAPQGTWVEVRVDAGGLRWKGYVQVPAPPRDTIDVTFPETGAVRGRFVRADGRPAAGIGATVAPRIAGIDPRSTGPSGPDGTFVLPVVPAGRATLHGWRDEQGSPEAATRPIVVPADGDLDLGDVVVWEDVRLEGRVLGADGAGVGGAAVTVTWNGGQGSRAVASAPGGRFSLRLPGARDALFTARRRDGTACVESIDLSATQTATLRLRPTGTVEVRVAREWDEAGWEVLLETASGSFSWEPEMDHEDRTATLRGIPVGRWVVVVRTDDATHRREVVVAAGGTAVVEMGP